MNHPPTFETIEQAQETIKSQVLSLCDTYSTSIKALLPVLKRSSLEPIISTSDQKIFATLLAEGTDHLQNLNQLCIEISDITNENRKLIFEVSAEVLTNTLNYLIGLPKNIEKTTLYSN